MCKLIEMEDYPNRIISNLQKAVWTLAGIGFAGAIAVITVIIIIAIL